MSQDRDRSPSTIDLAGTEGCPVYSADNKTLGHVKEVAGEYFKVDVSMHHDYWLSQDDVALASPHQIILNHAAKDVEHVKRQQPGPGPRAHPDERGDINSSDNADSGDLRA